jgi:hypothetical protein
MYLKVKCPFIFSELSFTKTLLFSSNVCVEMKRESLPSLVNRILHRFKLLTKDKVVLLLFVLVSVVLKEVALDFVS